MFYYKDKWQCFLPIEAFNVIIKKGGSTGNSLRICYGCNHILKIETLNRLLWFRFETWLRFRGVNRVATLIATLVATLIETSIPERFRVVIRVAIRVAIATLNRNPETYRFRFFLKIATLGVFYGCDFGFGFDRNLLKVFPGAVISQEDN